MTVRNGYRFMLEVRRLDGEVLRRELFTPDWEPAVQCGRLVGLRTLGVCESALDSEPRLEPLWHQAAGEPLIEGFRVHMTQGGLDWSADFVAMHYFADPARSVVAALVADKHLQADERVRYAIAAFAGAAGNSEQTLRFETSERSQPYVVRERSFAETVSRSRACGDADVSDIEVVMPEDVLEDVCALTRDAGEKETGGILLGHICRDEAPRGIGVEITAQIPARHTVGDAVKLTFTSDTWTDVRAAVALRRAEELLVGWWHSHPAHAWCKKCPIERQRVCRLTSGFLSVDDRALHRAMFPGAFSLALVVTHSVCGLESKLFGWRGGVLESRGFRLADT